MNPFHRKHQCQNLLQGLNRPNLQTKRQEIGWRNSELRR